MVHKKYTYKDGKRFGPYYYETKRMNGKVVTTYLGSHPPALSKTNRKNYQSIIYPLVFVLILSVLLLFAFTYSDGITGKASLEIKNKYSAGEVIDGTLRLKLRAGELIPKDSIITVNLGNSSEDFKISDLVNGGIISGDFYAEGLDLSGSGEGYGLIGQKKIHPDVDFKLNIIKENDETVPGESGGSSGTSIEGAETIPSNETISTEPESNETTEPEIALEEPTSEPTIEPEGTLEESSSSETETPEASITGAAISENERVVRGKTSQDEEFIYDLNSGEYAELVAGSVNVLGETLADDVIKIKNSQTFVRVTTDYEEIVEGFGEDFLGKDELTLELDIAGFGMIAQNDSEMHIVISYQDNIIAEATKDISIVDEELLPQDRIISDALTNESVIGVDLNVSVNTVQYDAVLGQPVKWKKHVVLSDPASIVLELPDGAENVTVVRVVEIPFTSSEESIVSEENQTPITPEAPLVAITSEDSVLTGSAISEIGTNEEDNSFVHALRKIFGFTGLVTIEGTQETDNSVLFEIPTEVTEVEIEYQTPAPIAEEAENARGKTVKIVGPDTLHYENVLAYTSLSEELNLENPGRVRIQWIENDTEITVNAVEDTDANGIYDYVEWVVPHLSNQTFEIIVITKAEHLDTNRTFISDIYDDVKELDGNWSEPIVDGHFVRITFEENLTNDNDITIYPRTVNGTPTIEVYENNGSEVIAEFTSISDNQYNKIFLIGLNGSQDIFDLKILGGTVEFDHIIDPSVNLGPDPNGVVWSGAISETTAYTFSTGATVSSACLTAMNASGGGGCLEDEGSSSLDAYFVWNVSIPDFVTIQSINITVTATTNGGAEPINISFWNFSASDWQSFTAEKTPSAAGVNVTLNYNITANNTGLVSGSLGQVMFMVRTRGNNARDLIVDFMEAKTTYTGPAAPFVDASPTVLFANPSNNTITTTGIVAFGAQFLDDVNASNATLYVYNVSDGVADKLVAANFTGLGNSSIMKNITHNIGLNGSGTFYWNFLAVDNATTNNRVFNLTNWTATYNPSDTAAPNEILINPSNNSVTTTGMVAFGAWFIDNVNASNATLYVYNSTNKIVAMNFTALGNASIVKNITHNVGLNGSGTYYWNYLALDNATTPNQAFNTSNYTLTFAPLDILAPNVSLLAPANGLLSNNSNHYFVTHLLDDINTSNVTLYIYNSTNVLIGTNFSKVGNSSKTINISYNLNYTNTFYWNFLATDNSSNSAFNNSNFTLHYNTSSISINGSMQYSTGGLVNVTFNLYNYLSNITNCNPNLLNGSTCEGNLGLNYWANITFNNNTESLQNIVVYGMNATSDLNSFMQFDNLPSNGSFDNLFAINPIFQNFLIAEVTFTANSNALLKCANWDFIERYCPGNNWTIIKDDMTVGNNYTFTMDAIDPGFGQINITNATHLDQNYAFINNIFEEVKSFNDVWSEPINHSHYVRVTFERNLTSAHDITLYPRDNRSLNRTTVWVYFENSSEKILEFPLLNETKYYTMLLAGYFNGSNATFDLKVVNWDNDTSAYLEFDHIIDPSSNNNKPILTTLGAVTATTVSNSSNDNLTISFTQTDFDNESTSNVTDWRLEGVSIAQINMPFDENETAGTTDLIRDYSTFLNNATLGLGVAANIPQWFNATDGKCIKGGCYWFDGSNDNIQVDDANSLDVVNNFTLMVWVYLNDDSKPGFSAGNIIDKLTSAEGSYNIVLNNATKKIRSTIRTSNGTSVLLTEGNPSIANDTWTHYAITYDKDLTSNNFKLYKNGVLNVQANANVGFIGNSTQRLIIASDTGAGATFNGSVDELKIFNVTLTVDAIRSIYMNESNYLLHSSLTEPGQNWSACVTPTDSFDFGVTNCTVTNVTVASPDTTSPNVTIHFPVSGETYGVNYLPLNFNVSLTESGSVAYSLDTGVNNITMVSSQDQSSLVGTVFNKSNASIADKSYTFRAYANDSAGNTNLTQTAAFTFNTSTPNISFVSQTPANNSILSTTSFIINLSTQQQENHYTFVDFNKSLVLWMRFENRNATQSPFDNSTYGNNASLMGNSIINSTGYFGDAAQFNASDSDRIQVSSMTFPGSNLSTFSFWVYPLSAGPGSLGNVFSFDTARTKVQFVDEDGNLRYYRGFTGSDGRWGGTTGDFRVTANQWTHVAVVHNASGPTNEAIIYINGTEVVTQSVLPTGGAVSLNSNALWIGNNATSADREFNGSIDDILMFNRLLNESEVYALYNASANRYFANFSGLSHGIHLFKGYTANSFGNTNETLHRTVAINMLPLPPAPILNATPYLNYTNSTLSVTALLSDPDADRMNVTVYWHNGTIRHLTQQFTSSYVNGTIFNATLDPGNTTKGENWTVGITITDGFNTTLQVNSSALFIRNAPPGVVPLRNPPTGTLTTDRTPNLQWNAPTDIDSSDTLTYHLNLTCIGGCSVDNRLQTGISGTDADVSSDLRYLYDNTFYYNWSVIAFDGTDNSTAWSTIRQINISALVSIDVLAGNRSVVFGTINQFGTNDTSDDSPAPILVANDGNSFVNISVVATQLWKTQASASVNYQFKIDNYTYENYSFIPSLSKFTYTNIPILPASALLGIAGLNYTNATDTVEVDINITVPTDEIAGSKNSTVTFTASLAECGGVGC